MQIIDKTNATQTLADYTSQIESGPVIVVSEGRPVAALIAIENTDLETVSLSTNPAFLELIERSRKSVKEKGVIPSGEMRRRFEDDIL